MSNVRRSGRTWAACEQALAAVTDSTSRVRFVVWHYGMKDSVEHYLRDISVNRGEGWKLQHIRVVSYEGRTRNTMGRSTFYVYDHYVTEQLEYRRTGVRQAEYVEAWLVVNGWTRKEVVPTSVLDRTPWIMAVHEPICYMVPGMPLQSDTVTMKTVAFIWRGKYKDGHPLLES